MKSLKHTLSSKRHGNIHGKGKGKAARRSIVGIVRKLQWMSFKYGKTGHLFFVLPILYYFFIKSRNTFLIKRKKTSNPSFIDPVQGVQKKATLTNIHYIRFVLQYKRRLAPGIRERINQSELKLI